MLSMTFAAVASQAWAQNSSPDAAPGSPAPSQQVETAPPAEPAPRRENPGLINEIGKLFQNPPSLLPSLKLPSAGPNPDPKPDPEIAAPAPPPVQPPSPETGSGVAMPRSLMVQGRMMCPVAANGAPDCKIASDQLCQTKGFREGKSLNTDAAEHCSPKAYIPGRQREPGDCRTHNYVTRAICQ